MITAVTCTGDRPVCFSLLEQWVKDQTVKVDQWIVVEDGKSQFQESGAYELFRRTPQKSDPKFTMILNLELALQKVKGDVVLFLEDDEYYAPEYVEQMNRELGSFQLVGIGRSKYYHLPGRKWYRHQNMGHASLAQTGFQRSFLKTALGCLKGDMFYDIRLWRMVNKDADNLRIPSSNCRHQSFNRDGLVFDDGDSMLYVGMKGLPGRGGIGIGHRELAYYVPDPEMSGLSNWVRNEHHFKLYTDLVR